MIEVQVMVTMQEQCVSCHQWSWASNGNCKIRPSRQCHYRWVDHCEIEIIRPYTWDAEPPDYNDQIAELAKRLEENSVKLANIEGLLDHR